MSGVFYGDRFENIEQHHDEQTEQIHAQLDPVEFVEFCDHVADEPVSRLERFDVSGDRALFGPATRERDTVSGRGRTDGVVTGGPRAVHVGFQHRRVSVGNDRRRFYGGYFLVDQPEVLVQFDTVR